MPPKCHNIGVSVHLSIRPIFYWVPEAVLQVAFAVLSGTLKMNLQLCGFYKIHNQRNPAPNHLECRSIHSRRLCVDLEKRRRCKLIQVAP